MMKIKITPEQRAEMAAYVDAQQPGLLDDLGIPRTTDDDCEDCGGRFVRGSHYCFGNRT